MNKSVAFAGGVLHVEGGEVKAISGRATDKVSRALKTMESWSGSAAETFSVEDVPEGTPEVLVNLGELTAVRYSSKKWDGKRREYHHDTSRPRPKLCTDPTGRRFYIVGGKMKATERGLVG